MNAFSPSPLCPVHSASENSGLWRTVLLEGQPLLRDLLAKSLHADRRFVLLAELDDPEQAAELCFRLRPTLLITDARMPQGEVTGLLQRLRQQLPATRVLVLSQSTDPLTIHRLHEIGVNGFVEKDQSLEILEEAMVEVASGRQYFTAIWSRTQAKLQSDPAAFPKFLSAREQEILRLVAAGRTSRWIAATLGLSLRSVETYRYRMMRKLGIKTLAGLIEFGVRLQTESVQA